jgi:hypothetical protein
VQGASQQAAQFCHAMVMRFQYPLDLRFALIANVLAGEHVAGGNFRAYRALSPMEYAETLNRVLLDRFRANHELCGSYSNTRPPVTSGLPTIHPKPDRDFSHRRSRIVSRWPSGMCGLRRPSRFRRAHHFQPALSGKKQCAQNLCLRCIRWPYVCVNNCKLDLCAGA